MNTSVWDAARMGRTAGIDLTATFHPDRITTRMRNAIKHMVMSGQLTGGWQSHAKRLARALCDKYMVPYHQSSAFRVTVPPATPKHLRDGLFDLLKADEAALRMGDGRVHHSVTARYDRDRDALQCEFAKSHTLYFQDQEIGRHACHLMRRFVETSCHDTRKMVCALLDGTDPIDLYISTY